MSYEQELKSAYAAARARLLTVAPAKPKIVQPRQTLQNKPKRKKETTRQKIIASVCEKYGVTLDDLKSNAVTKNIAAARHECFYRLRNEITIMGRPISLKLIGDAFNKNFSTVKYGISTHEKRLANV